MVSTKVRYELISADSHFNEPADLWQARVPARFRAEAPWVARTDNGDFWFAGDRQVVSVSGGARAGKKYEEYKNAMTVEEIRRGGYDPAARLADQDLDGVWSEVIYPTYGLVLLQTPDAELHKALVRAYNDWVAEFNAYNPERLKGIGVLPLTGAEDTIAEFQHIRDLGLPGAMLQTLPSGGVMPSKADEPFWALAEEANLPLTIHIRLGSLIGAQQKFVVPDPAGSPMLPRLVSNYALIAHGIQEALAGLIFGGVLERYPRLRVIAAEGGIGWIPYCLMRWDIVFERQRHWANLGFELKPSEYFRRQVWATFEEDVVGVKLAAATPEYQPVDRLLWASDYPHSDTTWPRSREVVSEHFHGLSPDLRQRIVLGNVAELYGIDLGRMRDG